MDDDVFREIKAYAESRDVAIGKAVSELVRRGLRAPLQTRMVNGFHVVELPQDSPPVRSEDVKKLEDDYLETKEWESIEEETIDRGTELLNLLLYLNECSDEDIEPDLEDYLKEFLLVDEDEFQDEHRIYEPVIENQILLESPVAEIGRMAKKLLDDSELKEIFYPMMCFFQNIEPSEGEKDEIAKNALDKGFDMAVLEILVNFN